MGAAVALLRARLDRARRGLSEVEGYILSGVRRAYPECSEGLALSEVEGYILPALARPSPAGQGATGTSECGEGPAQHTPGAA